MPSYHLLRSGLGLLALARHERRTGHGRRAAGRGRAESGPRKGTEETGVHAGLSGELHVSALPGRSNCAWEAGEGADDVLVGFWEARGDDW
jgi:hypothetical protein